MQSSATGATAPAATSSFEGIGAGLPGFTVQSAPPDTNGAVGPNHFVQTVNVSFAVFSKTGGVLYGPVAINTLFTGFGGLCEADNDGDPSVVYDQLADRWVITQFTAPRNPVSTCVAPNLARPVSNAAVWKGTLPDSTSRGRGMTRAETCQIS